jgi:Protein of unknown function (DUF2585)
MVLRESNNPPFFMKSFFQKYSFYFLSAILIFALVGLIEYSTGRSVFGPDGQFGWWDGNVWGSENSQRVADAYSFSHIIHGIIFYALLWLFARKLPLKYRFLLALSLEGGWELLENSPLIINRYREATIALGYVGDSILNSVCDIGMVIIGFIIARLSKVWISIVLIIIFELGCLFWIRDNLTLNVLMLVHPVESIKVWQSEGH